MREIPITSKTPGFEWLRGEIRINTQEYMCMFCRGPHIVEVFTGGTNSRTAMVRAHGKSYYIPAWTVTNDYQTLNEGDIVDGGMDAIHLHKAIEGLY